MRDKTEFYYRKGGKGLQVGSLPGRTEVPHAEAKKGTDFILGPFKPSLTWRWGKNSCDSHVQRPSGQGQELDGLMPTPMLILRYSP
jgi:hypothetical protein